MSLELEALSFRVMVESDLNVDGMLIEPAKKDRKNKSDKSLRESVNRPIARRGPDALR